MTGFPDDLPGAARVLRTRFESEVEPLRGDLWRYCHRLTGSAWDAEDLVQETMQRALARLAELWQPVNTRAYLFRIASNAWIDRRRREVRMEMTDLDDDLAAADAHPDLRIQAHEALARMVAVLTPLQRAVVLLCDTLDFTGPETAALLGSTEGAVKAALHRARRALAVAARPSEDAPPGGEKGVPAGAAYRETGELEPLVQRYVEAFDARDADAIAALFHEDAQATIVGCAVELGRDVIRANSLAEWAGDPVRQWARAGRLEGRDVLFVFSEGPGGAPRLHSLVELAMEGDGVREQRTYYFCPELLEHAASALGVEAETHGHQYPFA